MDSRPVFTIDLEDWNDAFHIDRGDHSSLREFEWIIRELEKLNIHPIIYKLEYIIYKSMKYEVRTHGRYHRWWENADRRPYQWLGLTGGFWFRFLPYWFVKGQVIKHGMFYCHPHDFDEEHPKLNNPILNWKRHVGLRGAKKKMIRLLGELSWQ